MLFCNPKTPLIVPYGIETRLYRAAFYLLTPLIVPYGIETMAAESTAAYAYIL